jgi:hypothetical protein
MIALERYRPGWDATRMDAAGMARSGACQLLTGRYAPWEV